MQDLNLLWALICSEHRELLVHCTALAQATDAVTAVAAAYTDYRMVAQPLNNCWCCCNGLTGGFGIADMSSLSAANSVQSVVILFLKVVGGAVMTGSGY